MAEERTAVLDAVTDHGDDTRSLFFRIPGGLTFRPGQFLSCLLPIAGERVIRPYSIASSPEQPARIELLLNLVPGGPGSRYLFGLAPRASLDFTGPWGTFVLDRAPDAEAVFIAIDTGIAPIRPMLRRAAATATLPLTLVYASRHPLYLDELGRLPRVAIDVVSPDALETRIRTRWLERDDDRTRHFFICGVGEVVPRLRDMLRGGGYMRRAVQYEKW
ncbi:MAG TPA: FAD-dependent oxidoreductase [Candidatus Binatia bacterium]|nr:FAD-dependent oxidoreductase [Candidatus Binatia bacterium]